VKINLFNWNQYTAYAVVKTIKKDTSLFRQGERVNGFYYLQQGTIAISVIREDGYERIIDLIYSGSLLGERIINDSMSFTNATALVDSILYFFSREQFELLIKDHPKASHQFSVSLINKVRLMANINTILNAPIDVQLAQFLLNLAEREQNNCISINQTSLSKYIGKSRVSIWKVLKDWRLNEVIEMKRQTIVLKDLDTLQELIKL